MFNSQFQIRFENIEFMIREQINVSHRENNVIWIATVLSRWLTLICSRIRNIIFSPLVWNFEFNMQIGTFLEADLVKIWNCETS